MYISRYTKHFLIVAIVIFVIAIGIIASVGLRFGIDFTGGSLTEVSYDTRPPKADVDASLQALDSQITLRGYSLRGTVDETGKDGFILRTRDLNESERQAVEKALTDLGDGAQLTRFTSIGPVIGEELKSKAVWAIVAVVLVIVVYVAFAFRKVSEPIGSWVYGGITIIALVHDVLVPTAIMSLMGYFLGAEIDVLFVMAILAVLGYSVNDTIVVFDRVRENLIKYRQARKSKKGGSHTSNYSFSKPFGEIVGESVVQTMLRSINTSLTTFIALTALFYFGGDVTRNFALVLMAGVVAGTYSSVFIANPMLIFFGERKIRKENS